MAAAGKFCRISVQASQISEQKFTEKMLFDYSDQCVCQLVNVFMSSFSGCCLSPPERKPQETGTFVHLVHPTHYSVPSPQRLRGTRAHERRVEWMNERMSQNETVPRSCFPFTFTT